MKPICKKVVLESHLLAKCEHGLKFMLLNCVNIYVEKIYKLIYYVFVNISISKANAITRLPL